MDSSVIAPALAGNVLGSVGNDFVVAEWKDAGGPPGPPRWIAPLHLHRHDDEAWYVLEGTHVLESRAGLGALSAGDDFECIWTHSGHPCNEGAVSGGAVGGI